MLADISTVSLLTTALSQSVPLIKEIIASSLGLRKNVIDDAKDTEQLQYVFVEKILEKTEKEGIAESPDIAADTLMSSWIVDTRKALSEQRQASLSEARISFTIALSAIILGILLVFTGVILIFTIGLQIGAVTSSSSIVSGIVCALAVKFNQQAHNRLDTVTKEMNSLDNVYTATILASQISDKTKRDSAIEELVRRWYQGPSI